MGFLEKLKEASPALLLNLRHPGCPAYDFYEKSLFFSHPGLEQKFGTRGYKALLEHSFEYCMKVEAIVVSHG